MRSGEARVDWQQKSYLGRLEIGLIGMSLHARATRVVLTLLDVQDGWTKSLEGNAKETT